MEQKQDLRVVKTRRNIEDAFLRLLETHDFERISVRMIIEEALISRITFYNHYEDKYDLARRIARKYLDTLKSDMTIRLQTALFDQEITDKVAVLPDAMTEYREMYRVMKKLPPEVMDIDESMQQIIRDILTESPLPAEYEPKHNELVPMILSSLVMTYWKYCVTESDPLPLSDYVGLMQDIATFYGKHTLR